LSPAGDDGLLPGPFAQPGGPAVEDRDVVVSFARGEPAGHSEHFHVEDVALVLEPLADPLAVFLAPGSVLVRHELWGPTFEEPARLIAQALEGAGLTLLDEETLLGTAVAMQTVALREPTWDLWGTDIDAAFIALRAAAAGGADQPLPPI